MTTVGTDADGAQRVISEPTNIVARLGDVNAAAIKLKLSVKTIRRMVDARKIPGVFRLGKLIRFNLDLFDRWIDQGCPPVYRFDCGKRSDNAIRPRVTGGDPQVTPEQPG
jgi:excisionase family DNA binding protein